MLVEPMKVTPGLQAMLGYLGEFNDYSLPTSILTLIKKFEPYHRDSV